MQKLIYSQIIEEVLQVLIVAEVLFFGGLYAIIVWSGFFSPGS